MKSSYWKQPSARLSWKSLGRNAGSDPCCTTRFFTFTRQTAVERLNSIILLVQLETCIRKRWFLKNFWSTHPRNTKTSSLLFDNTDTYIHKVFILKNNRTQPQTHMRTTVISYSIYRSEPWRWLSLHSPFCCSKFLSWVSHNFPRLSMGRWESAFSTCRFPILSPSAPTALLPLHSFSNEGKALPLLTLSHLTFQFFLEYHNLWFYWVLGFFLKCWLLEKNFVFSLVFSHTSFLNIEIRLISSHCQIQCFLASHSRWQNPSTSPRRHFAAASSTPSSSPIFSCVSTVACVCQRIPSLASISCLQVHILKISFILLSSPPSHCYSSWYQSSLSFASPSTLMLWSFKHLVLCLFLISSNLYRYLICCDLSLACNTTTSLSLPSSLSYAKRIY